jgi:hypothetical protein
VKKKGVPHCLEENLELAIDGGAVEIKAFYTALLSTNLFIPDRNQKIPLQTWVTYPNPFMNLMGVSDGERSIIPVFTEQAYIKAWCGRALSYQEMPGKKLLDLAPLSWWICINPGCDAEKEISPWEISHLRGGAEGIDVVVAEIIAQREEDALPEVEEIPAADFKPLIAELLKIGKEYPQILSLRALLQRRESNQQEILIGCEVLELRTKRTLHKAITDRVAQFSIGELPIKIIIGNSLTMDPALALLAAVEPLYVQKKSPRKARSLPKKRPQRTTKPGNVAQKKVRSSKAKSMNRS